MIEVSVEHLELSNSKSRLVSIRLHAISLPRMAGLTRA